MNNCFEKYFRNIKPEYIEKLYAKIAEGIRYPDNFFEVEYEVCKAVGKSAWFGSKGKTSLVADKVSIFGYTIDISKQKTSKCGIIKSRRIS